MNKKNLKKAIKHMKTVDPELFNMSSYRLFDRESHICDSIGCVVGHCTALANPKTIPLHPAGSINFNLWANEWFGLEKHPDTFYFLFDASWARHENSLKQAIRRMKYIYKYEVPPKNWNFNTKITKKLKVK